ncbi:hypothetical protein BOTBODRAFT_430218 [Botryobasidium botryosum FD-172 SS1]|uniref:Uncharacterized protein n=1 Tax=Botryobasidium botryosum (strain FD-172 SS1) TaxID=930990 RepID=A0A067M908_BOTB1|nr:hypothetical protein BOTBODRAFT_430218 [Botryobasidium botryosum FD-172 SS1]
MSIRRVRGGFLRVHDIASVSLGCASATLCGCETPLIAVRFGLQRTISFCSSGVTCEDCLKVESMPFLLTPFLELSALPEYHEDTPTARWDFSLVTCSQSTLSRLLSCLRSVFPFRATSQPPLYIFCSVSNHFLDCPTLLLSIM